jgi:hypothetical protein
MDSIAHLALVQILDHLSAAEKIVAMRVCRRWCNLLASERDWGYYADRVALLDRIAHHGSLEAVRTWAPRLRVERVSVISSTLNSAAKNPNVEVIDWLLRRYDITVADLRMSQSPLVVACNDGNVAVAQHLLDRLAWEKADIYETRMLNYACGHANNRGVLEAIVERFGTEISAEKKLNCVATAGDAGHLEWFIDTFAVAEEDLFAHDCLCLRTLPRHFDVMRRLMTRFGVGREQGIKMFAHACQFPDIRAMTWLANVYSIAARDMLGCLDLACRAGQIANAAWLLSHHDLRRGITPNTPAIVCRAELWDMLDWMCVHLKFRTRAPDVIAGVLGHCSLERTQRVMKATGITVQDLCEHLNHEAIVTGDVELIKWVVTVAESPVDTGDALMRSACSRGHIGLAQWSADRFGAADLDIPGAFEIAHAKGHLDVAAWLSDRFGYTPGLATGRLLIPGREDSIMWLIRNYDVSNEVLADYDHLKFRMACYRGMERLARLIAQRCTIPDETIAKTLAGTEARGYLAVAAWLRTLR